MALKILLKCKKRKPTIDHILIFNFDYIWAGEKNTDNRCVSDFSSIIFLEYNCKNRNL